jgi:hypothetical protein
MSAHLAAARTMSFTAVASYESPSWIGPPFVYMTTSEVTLQRPDKLRVITPACRSLPKAEESGRRGAG